MSTHLDPHAARHRRTLASRRKLSSRQPDFLANQLSSLSSYTTIRVSSSTVVDFSGLALKRDHSRRPYWVTPVGRIFLEASSPLYSQARDFLIAICEPVSRPEMIHEYRLDKNALFAAASMGMTGDMIIQALNRMSKVPVAESVADFVRDWTSGYGKVKLVLRRGRFYIESSYPAVLRLLNKHPTIRASRVRYLVDGTRIVGLDGEDASSSSSLSLGVANSSIDLTNDGFTVERALAETDASLGLGGVLSRRQDREARFGGQSMRRARATDTQSGTLAGRILGEVESEDEGGGGGDLQGDLEGEEALASFESKKSGGTTTTNSSSSSTSWNAAVTRTNKGSSSSSSAAAALQGDWDSLSSAELAAMLVAVEQAEAQYEERQRQALAAKLLREEQAAKTKAMLLRDTLGTQPITKDQAGKGKKAGLSNRKGTSEAAGEDTSALLKRRRKKIKVAEGPAGDVSSSKQVVASSDSTMMVLDGGIDDPSSNSATDSKAEPKSNVFTTRSGLVFASVDGAPKRLKRGEGVNHEEDDDDDDDDDAKAVKEESNGEPSVAISYSETTVDSSIPTVAAPTSSVIRSAAIYAAAMASAGLETDTSEDNNDAPESGDSDFESDNDEEETAPTTTTSSLIYCLMFSAFCCE
jgi:hypothetical protein